MLLNASTIHSGLYSNIIWTASIGSSSGPHVFPFPILAICFFTSSNEKHSTGPSVVGNSCSCSLGFSPLMSLSTFCFHLPLICADSVKMFLSSFLMYAMSDTVFCPGFQKGRVPSEKGTISAVN